MSLFLYIEYESEPEASEFDLGKKIRAPKDIMLEELSLQKNKGSKMFKMRQIRVQKFIYENNPDLFSSESMVRQTNLCILRLKLICIKGSLFLNHNSSVCQCSTYISDSLFWSCSYFLFKLNTQT